MPKQNSSIILLYNVSCFIINKGTRKNTYSFYVYLKLLFYKKRILSGHIIIVKLTKYKLRKTAKNKGIIGCQNKPKKELLRIIYKLKRITENLSRNELNKIVKMQNLSLNELKKIERMNNLSLNALGQMAIARHIKNYKDMSKEDLLIALLKSNQSYTELLKTDDSNTEI